MTTRTTELPPPGEPTEGDAHVAVRVRYERDAYRIVRAVRTPIGGTTASVPAVPGAASVSPAKAWWSGRARGSRPAFEARPRGRVRTVDLFSGAGGLSLGTAWAIEAVGRRSTPLLAVDVEADALDVHQYNHLPRKAYVGSVRDLLVAGEFATASEPTDVPTSAVLAPGAEWLASLGEADVVFGGPPCQGHSNLNNRTRRTDDRNQLYYWMALAAHVFRAKAVIVENVASVKADAGDVVGDTIDAFERLGYRVLLDEVLAADRFAVAQTRRRHFLVAVRSDVEGDGSDDAMNWLRSVEIAPFTLMDAIGDLQDAVEEEGYDAPSKLSDENQQRIDHLFDEDLYDLPDPQRPASHRDGHTYPSVYGRMRPDRPAGTISTGFLTPGRGRYVHPTRRRTMTLHEGARVQGFPDDFRFVGATGTVPARTAIARMIGDAVPPPMAFHVALATLASLKPDALGGR